MTELKEPGSEIAKDKNKDWNVTITRHSLIESAKRKSRIKLLKAEQRELRVAIRKSRNEPLEGQQKEINKHLNNIRNILLNSNATPIKSHTGLGYSCCFCTESFPLPRDLKIHTLEKHDNSAKSRFMKGFPLPSFVVKLDITALECQVCEKDIKGLQQLMEHLQTQHNIKMYTDINNQIIPFKFEGEQLDCVLCPKSYERFKLLQEHMNIHYRNYICEICNSPFINKRTLKSHMARHKQGEFSCSYCPKIFDTQNKKSNHENFVHIGNDKRNKCPHCNEKFSTYAKKYEHMVEKHGEKPLILKCMACDKTFTRRDRLTRHTKRDHLLERKYGCEHCDMNFYAKKELNMHMLKHTGVKKFACEICQKPFARKHTLKEHLRIHADDRRYKCEYCSLAFIQKCTWKSHLRTKHEKNV